MHIQTFFEPDTSTKTYVVFDEATRDAVIIDPVLEYDPVASKVSNAFNEQVLAYVRAEKLKVHLLLETHIHADHLSGAQHLKGALAAKVAVGARVSEVQTVFKGFFDLGPGFATDGRQFDVLVEGGQTLSAGSLKLAVLATPGHTPACVSYRVGDAVFTGDVLLHPDNGVARCDFPGGDAGVLFDSVTQRLYTLPDDTRVFPGHDYAPKERPVRDFHTVAEAKAKNALLPAGMARDAFVKVRTTRDATLSQPRLLYPSVQVNVAAGALPSPNAAGQRFFKVPVRGP